MNRGIWKNTCTSIEKISCLLYSSQIMIMCSFYLKCIDDKIFIFKLKQKVKSKSLDSIGHLIISGTL